MPARKVDPVEFARMYRAGAKMLVMARRFGVTIGALKLNRKQLGLKRRPPGNWRYSNRRPEVGVT